MTEIVALHCNATNDPNDPNDSAMCLRRPVAPTQWCTRRHFAGGRITTLESCGYVGIQGSDLRIGLPLTERFFVKADLAALAVPNTRIVLKRELDPTAEGFETVKFGAASGAGGELEAAADADEGNLCFGISEMVDGANFGRLLWFIWGNRGYRN